ncbi:hypothetical protein [Cardiobacterium hominis]
MSAFVEAVVARPFFAVGKEVQALFQVALDGAQGGFVLGGQFVDIQSFARR